jgi:hypothetical protein
MKHFLFFYLVITSCQLISGQNQIVTDSINNTEIDKLYKEDQFYIGITYLLLNDLHKDMSQHGFSTGLSFGYIKDIPLNKDRNFGLGIGIGLSSNSLNQNLKISKTAEGIDFEFLDADEFTKNKIATQLVEIPIEIRWRTSTPESYKFWRVYAGVKFGYLIASKAKYKGGGESLNYSNLNAFEKFNYGLSLSAGYNTWNLNLYYGLNSILENSPNVNNENVKIRTINIGLIFYLL